MYPGAPQLTQATDSTARKFPPVLSRHPVLYCLVVVGIPIAAMIATVFIMRTAWFLPRSGNTYIATVGYAAGLHNLSCDVLIDGDSTAMVGVIPAVITRQTGLSACNIAEFAGMEQVNGRMMLNHFLANNPRPRYIVFVYPPESLKPHDQWTPVSHFEALLFRLRTQPDAAFLHSLLTHPTDILSSWTLGLRLVAQAPFHKPMSEQTLRQREEGLGWLDVPGRILTTCGQPESLTPPDPAYVAGLRSQFGVDGTKVFVDVIPEPDCEPDYDFFTPKLAGTVDNRQQKFPISLYNSGGRLHLIPEGAQRFSLQIADQINRQNPHRTEQNN